jgi:diadenosine tetraphosphatase ApaH/serine/threonine PP2A family protein phosphatase
MFRLNSTGDEEACEPMLPSLNGSMALGSERMIINPGSVGQPRDGDSRASYALLDAEAFTIEHRRVAYAVEKTQAKMMEQNLPLRLVLRLAYGW